MSDKIKLGVLGCGPRGLQMAAIAKLMPERFVLSAMSDPDEEPIGVNFNLSNAQNLQIPLSNSN